MCAPSVAADRPQYFTQDLFPSMPGDRHLLVGGDFNCIAGPPGQRTLGYWTVLRHVETDHNPYDVWRDLNAGRRAFIHIATSGQSAARLDRWLISDHLGVSLCLTAPASTLYGAAVRRLPLHLLDDSNSAIASRSWSQHTKVRHTPTDQS